MPFAALEGVRRGCRAVVSAAPAAVRPSPGWLGRGLNAVGEAIDGKGSLPGGPAPYAFRSAPPPAHARRRGGAPPPPRRRAPPTPFGPPLGPRAGGFPGSR